MAASVSYHPAHPGWRRLFDAVLASEQTPGDPPALMGLDDVDEATPTDLSTEELL